MAIIYLNGQWSSDSEAKVSVFDRGFLFADSVYEVIPAYASNFFRFEEHIQRLNQSLESVKMNLRFDVDEWLSIGKELLTKNDLKQASLYLQVSRGPSAIRSHEFPAEITPTIFAMVSELPPVVTNKQEAKGIQVISCEDIRWDRCDIKTTGLLANCLLLQKALESGADDSILVRDGKVLESTSSNVFVVKSGQILTPKLSDELLAGVTREFVMLLARNLGYSVLEVDLYEADLQQADEIWLTSSNKEIRPVVGLNHAKIGNGEVGSVWREMNQAYQKLKYNLYQGEFSEIAGINTL